jgi:glycosyltransferase involved in cell wall biosynthesis
LTAPAFEPVDVILVDPSLFTAPYDAALTAGLLAAGVRPLWAVRPTRPGDRQEIDPIFTDAFFYRNIDQAVALPGPLRTVIKGLAHAMGLARLVQRVWLRRPAAVHFQWVVLPSLDVVAITLIRRVCPVVITVHDSDPFNGDKLSLLQGLGLDLSLRAADRLIVHTSAAQGRLTRRGLSANKITVIPHGPLKLHARSACPSSATANGKRVFVLFGEIKPYKGIDVLMEAVAMLPVELRRQTKVIVAGRPRMDMSSLERRLKELQLQGVIEIRPHRLSEQEMADLFAEAHCFLFPYLQIDASGVYFLVKSLGRWLIASRVGVFAEDMQEGVHGTLVEPSNPEALSGAIAHFLLERPMAQPRPDSAVDWLSIGRQTRDLYGRMVARTAPESAPHDLQN